MLRITDQRRQDGGQDVYDLNHSLPKHQEQLLQQLHHCLKACRALMSR